MSDQFTYSKSGVNDYDIWQPDGAFFAACNTEPDAVKITVLVNSLIENIKQLEADLAAAQATAEDFKEAAISNLRLYAETHEDRDKWKSDYFALRNTMMDIPEYVEWLIDGTDESFAPEGVDPDAVHEATETVTTNTDAKAVKPFDSDLFDWSPLSPEEIAHAEKLARLNAQEDSES